VAEPGASRADDHAYFRRLEEVFIALRGAPLLLSPEDWRLARDWHRQGIPLELVEGVLRDLFARRAAQGKEERVNSLRYCRPAVEAAWRREQKLRAAGRPVELAELDVGERLERLAAALPPRLPERRRWQQRIRALEGDPETVEVALRSLDRELLAAVEERLTPRSRAALDAALERARATLAERLPAEQVERATARLRRQLLRQRRRLPLLSLFAPEALPPEDEPAPD